MISIRNFSKSFDDLKVIDDLTFDVKKGEIFAYLGANGSGKTTTLRALLGIYAADSGELLIKGKPYSTEMSNILGYLPEERGLYLESKVLETMTYFGNLKGLSLLDSKNWSENYLEEVGLVDKANEKIKNLSSGQQQKIQLGITIINKPKLLILDEPTKGLDPVNRDLLMDKLLELHSEGATILFSSHQMEEVEKIADSVLMLKEGKAALYGDLEEIKKSFGDNTIKLHFRGKLPRKTKFYEAKVEKNTAELTPKEGVKDNEILKFLIENDVNIISFALSSPSLHEIFVQVSKFDYEK
jgi:ABC-2 type transport system ATP-binding protein